MSFETEAQRACFERVQQYLRDVFGEMAQVATDEPAWVLAMGSAAVLGAVFAWGEDRSVVTNRAYVVRGVEVDPELALFLLRKNNEFRFGAFGLDDEGVFFEHSVLGDKLDAEELKTSIQAVLSTADRYDDEITARWGGRRGTD